LVAKFVPEVTSTLATPFLLHMFVLKWRRWHKVVSPAWWDNSVGGACDPGYLGKVQAGGPSHRQGSGQLHDLLATSEVTCLSGFLITPFNMSKYHSYFYDFHSCWAFRNLEYKVVLFRFLHKSKVFISSVLNRPILHSPLQYFLPSDANSIVDC
jgi:hypothetical protein